MSRHPRSRATTISDPGREASAAGASERTFQSRYQEAFSWAGVWRSASAHALRWLAPLGMLLILGWALEGRLRPGLWLALLVLPSIAGLLGALGMLFLRPARLRVRPGWVAYERVWDVLCGRAPRFRRLKGARLDPDGALHLYFEAGEQETLHPADWPAWRLLVRSIGRAVLSS
ncbi:MAG: hypothetical protein RML47_09900 [Bacteroidota bacterium]|nr:hypothetical protein [Rhodothermia bacterium]MCS7154380.1 hypothetical protein [Bacteroidota bacterium]MDW8137755.1 hypothetical protein [Bacteroidota bacterium]MDW8286395.1 hypothetical protein [Bacteroidota bacterium]